MKNSVFLIILCFAVSCTGKTVVFRNELPPIYPDYAGVTVPAGIAPLDFDLPDSFDFVEVKVTGSRGGVLSVNGKCASFGIRKWHRLTAKNVGGELTVEVIARKNGEWTGFRDFKIYVSEYPLDDFGITYRKMAPGYETYSKIGIYQRDIHSFKEYPILESTLLPGHCMGCHTANRCSAEEYMFHLRGKHGATFLQKGGEGRWLSTKTDSTKGNIVYTYWHPSGNWFAATTNKVAQLFWVSDRQRIEVFDFESDLTIIDARTNEMVLNPLLMTNNRETCPAFSADGSTLYFCLAGDEPAPADVEDIRYDLCSVPFDPLTGCIGDRIDTVLNAQAEGKSITWPRPSYDGKWLMYCLSDFSCFPINRPEADLWILDLKTGEKKPLEEVNSNRPESYHNWSTGSRWFLFVSRREDNMYGRVYLACIGDDGRVTKPFLLPQRHPRNFYKESLYSYNVPDFTEEKVELDISGMHGDVFGDERSQTVIRK